MEVETKAQRIERLRELKRHRPGTYARMLAAGRVTAEDIAAMSQAAQDEAPHDG